MGLQHVEPKREFGVDFISDVPWGTHICAFYQERQDYLDTVLPYLKTGLERNEFCIWIIPMWLTIDDAVKCLQDSVPLFEQYRQQIKIFTINEWYLQYDTFKPGVLVEAWTKLYHENMKNGWDGARACGSPYWRGHRSWDLVAAYEEIVEQKVGPLKLLVLCLYDIADLDIHQILDLTGSHELAFFKCRNSWKYSAKAAEVNRLNTAARMAAGIMHET